ncbi:hypothetical protein SLEP1_g50960 [Rubroshorea leprosula]|uniref:Nudix hydrolase domain-containing protein n=1 Tax=Rubroshorea leprosula TaxID=152421 RepID=A0AAV5M1R6_9ROSI|nr:hypothetical protein SLEP1_g50960 [Rubroshorea leprosula]
MNMGLKLDLSIHASMCLFSRNCLLGGIEDGEEPKSVALRELQEETGVVSAEIIAEVPNWLTYDFPPAIKAKVNRLRGGEWHGQAQKWFISSCVLFFFCREVHLWPRFGFVYICIHRTKRVACKNHLTAITRDIKGEESLAAMEIMTRY